MSSFPLLAPLNIYQPVDQQNIIIQRWCDSNRRRENVCKWAFADIGLIEVASPNATFVSTAVANKATDPQLGPRLPAYIQLWPTANPCLVSKDLQLHL
jgi:hypothetical protein